HLSSHPAQVRAGEAKGGAVQLVRSWFGAHDREHAGALVQTGGEERSRIEACQRLSPASLTRLGGASAVAIEAVHPHQSTHCAGPVGVGEQASERASAL